MAVSSIAGLINSFKYPLKQGLLLKESLISSKFELGICLHLLDLWIIDFLVSFHVFYG